MYIHIIQKGTLDIMEALKVAVKAKSEWNLYLLLGLVLDLWQPFVYQLHRSADQTSLHVRLLVEESGFRIGHDKPKTRLLHQNEALHNTHYFRTCLKTDIPKDVLEFRVCVSIVDTLWPIVTGNAPAGAANRPSAANEPPTNCRRPGRRNASPG